MQNNIPSALVNVKGHKYVSLLMFSIIIGFIIYGLYYYYNSNYDKNIKIGYSYYNSNLLNYTPLYNINTDTLDECISRCNADIICNGITYNNQTQECIGSGNNGLLRREENNLISWIKQNDMQTNYKRDFIKSIILGYTDIPATITANKITQPHVIGNFSFSFNLCIRDYHHNYGKWRHILHKGTDNSSLMQNNAYNYSSWEKLIIDIPKQFIGVWIAPFNNNMRIALSTIYMTKKAQNYYEHANIQICNENLNECHISDKDKNTNNSTTNLSMAPQQIIKNIEFIDQDITNIPINRISNYIINIIANTIELYQDGKLIKSAVIEGTAEYNNDNMYVMQQNSINGFVSNVIYYPAYLTLDDIKLIHDIPRNS